MSTFRTVGSVVVEGSAGPGDGFQSSRGAGRTIELPWSLPNAISHAASFDHVRGRSNERTRKPLEIIAPEDGEVVIHVFEVNQPQRLAQSRRNGRMAGGVADA